jgi:hypothetical protein
MSLLTRTSTPAQIAANEVNGRRSGGPATAEGHYRPVRRPVKARRKEISFDGNKPTDLVEKKGRLGRSGETNLPCAPVRGSRTPGSKNLGMSFRSRPEISDSRLQTAATICELRLGRRETNPRGLRSALSIGCKDFGQNKPKLSIFHAINWIQRNSGRFLTRMYGMSLRRSALKICSTWCRVGA